MTPHAAAREHHAPVTVRAPAKVNLGLTVGPLLDDGFHDLATVYHAVSLYEEVTATATEPGSGITLEVVGEGAAGVPTDDGNLAWRAAELVAEALGVRPDVHLLLAKGVPVAGGMAGGSADGAAALLACDTLWQGALHRDDLVPLAAALGSDVPFALHGGTAIGTGRGDRVTPVLARGTFHWVVAVSDVGLSTPEVYAECDRMRAGRPVARPEVSDELMAALRAGDAAALGVALSNDLQAPALSLRPSLHGVLDAGAAAGALGGVVSGSGPTCVFLARDDEHALDVSASLADAGVCRSVRRAVGPVHGARVVATESVLR